MDIYQTEEEQVEALKKWWAENGKSAVFGVVLGLGAIFGWREWQDYETARAMAASELYQELVVAARSDDAVKLEDRAQDIIAEYDTTGGDVRLVAEDTGVFLDASVPDRFALFQNYPNPLNPATVIAYQVPHACEVVLKIFNVMGEEIRTLVQENRRSGRHVVVWDGTDTKGLRVPSGIYFIRMRAGPYEEIRKMTVLY